MNVIINAKSWQTSLNKDQFIPLCYINHSENIFERQLRILSKFNINNLIIVADEHIEELKQSAGKYVSAYNRIVWVQEEPYKRNKEFLELKATNNIYTDDIIIVTASFVFNKSDIINILSEEKKSSYFASNEGNTVNQDHIFVKLCYHTGQLMNATPVDQNAAFAVEINKTRDIFLNIETILRMDHYEEKIKIGKPGIEGLNSAIVDAGIKKLIVITDKDNEGFIRDVYFKTEMKPEIFVIEPLEDQNSQIEKIMNTIEYYSCDAIISVGGQKAVLTGKRVISNLINKVDKNRGLVHYCLPNQEAIEEAVKPSKISKSSLRGLYIDYQLLSVDQVFILADFFWYSNRNLRANYILELLCKCIDLIWSPDCNDKTYEIVQKAVYLLKDNMFLFIGNHTIKDETVQAIAKTHFLYEIANYYGERSLVMHLVDVFADKQNMIEKGLLLSLCAPVLWEYYIKNIKNCTTKLTRKQLSNSANRIKELLTVDTEFEIKDILIAMIVQTYDNQYEEMNFDDIACKINNIIDKINQKDSASFFTPVPIYKIDRDLIKNNIKIQSAKINDEISNVFKKHISNWSEFRSIWRSQLLNDIRKKIRKERKRILEDVIDLFDNNNIMYYLFGSTLLGAVHVGDFISSNDEIHISVPREDYERLFAYDKKLNDRDLYLHSFRNDDFCWFAGARVCRKGTHIITEDEGYFYSKTRGINISIWPMDRRPCKNDLKEKIIFKLLRGMEAVIQHRLHSERRGLKWKGRVVLLFTKYISIKRLHLFRRKLLTFGNAANYGCFLIGTNFSYGKEKMPINWFDDSTYLPFGNNVFRVPSKYNEVLHRIYGESLEINDLKYRYLKKPLQISFESSQKPIKFLNGLKMIINSKRCNENSKNGNIKKRINKIKKIISKQISAFKKQIDIYSTIITGYFRSKGILISQNSKLLAAYKKKYNGQRCFLIGNGPSLTAEDLDKLKNEVTFGCNLIYKIFDQTEWRPTYYCISDSSITRTMTHEIIGNLEYSKPLIREFAYRFMEIKPTHAITLPYISAEKYIVKGDILAYHYISKATVMSMMIEIAIYMGFKEIYLLGVDGGSSSSKGSHFVDNYLSSEAKAHIMRLKQKINKDYDPVKTAVYLNKRSLSVYEQLKEFTNKKGIKIYNATRGGNIELFERVNIDTIFRNQNNHSEGGVNQVQHPSKAA